MIENRKLRRTEWHVVDPIIFRKTINQVIIIAIFLFIPFIIMCIILFNNRIDLFIISILIYVLLIFGYIFAIHSEGKNILLKYDSIRVTMHPIDLVNLIKDHFIKNAIETKIDKKPLDKISMKQIEYRINIDDDDVVFCLINFGISKKGGRLTQLYIGEKNEKNNKNIENYRRLIRTALDEKGFKVTKWI